MREIYINLGVVHCADPLPLKSYELVATTKTEWISEIGRDRVSLDVSDSYRSGVHGSIRSLCISG